MYTAKLRSPFQNRLRRYSTTKDSRDFKVLKNLGVLPRLSLSSGSLKATIYAEEKKVRPWKSKRAVTSNLAMSHISVTRNMHLVVSKNIMPQRKMLVEQAGIRDAKRSTAVDM